MYMTYPYLSTAAAATAVACAGGCIWSLLLQQRLLDDRREPEPEPEPEPSMAPAHYVVAIHPPPGPVYYPRGTEVYAQLKAGAGSQGWARAVVTGAVSAFESTASATGLETGERGSHHTIRVLGGVVPSFTRQHAGSELQIPTERLIMLPTDTRLVIAAETADYRRLSRAFATPADFVVDIGCSYGEGTKLIAAQCPRVLGLELVSGVVEAARRRHPHIWFEQLDCLAANPAELTALCKGCTKVFIDINGTRVLNHVAQIVLLVQQMLRPQLILLKSRQMHKLACEEGVCTADGVLTATERWNGLLVDLAQGKQPKRQQLHPQAQRSRSESGENNRRKERRVASKLQHCSLPASAGHTDALPELSRRERRACAKAAKRQVEQQQRWRHAEKHQ